MSITGSGGNTTSTSGLGSSGTGAAETTGGTNTNTAGSNALSKFESNSNRFRIYFNSPPELDRAPKVRGNAGNKRWRRDSSVATSVVVGTGGGGEKGLEAEGKEQEQEQGQGQGQGQEQELKVEAQSEQGQEQSEIVKGEPVEGEASSTKAGAETQQDDTVPVPISDNSAPPAHVPVKGEAETNEQDQDQVEQAIEGQLSFADEGEGEGEGEELSSYHQPEQEQQEAGDAQETVEVEQGDVSMRTDQGDLNAFLQGPHEDEVPADGEAEAFGENDAAVDENVVPEEGEDNILEQNGQDAAEEGAEPVAVETVQSADAPTTGEEQPNAAVITAQDIPNPAEPNAATEGATATPASTDEKKVADDSAEAIAAALAVSASNTASAYKSRARRHSSVSTTSEYPRAHGSTTTNANVSSKGGIPQPKEGQPSWNRLSILWEDSRRRMCFDVDVVEKVKIWRKEGKIEVKLKVPEMGGQEEGAEARLPKGILVSNPLFVDLVIPETDFSCRWNCGTRTRSVLSLIPFQMRLLSTLRPNLILPYPPSTSSSHPIFPWIRSLSPSQSTLIKRILSVNQNGSERIRRMRGCLSRLRVERGSMQVGGESWKLWILIL